MRVIDSSAWIEWLTKSAAGTRLQAGIPERDQCIVPTIVQLELSKWLSREKDEEAVDSFIAYTATCMVVSLDTTLARRAAEYRQLINSPPPMRSFMQPRSAMMPIS